MMKKLVGVLAESRRMERERTDLIISAPQVVRRLIKNCGIVPVAFGGTILMLDAALNDLPTPLGILGFMIALMGPLFMTGLRIGYIVALRPDLVGINIEDSESDGEKL